MKRRHVTCFWRRPLGHRWEHAQEGRYHFSRCNSCGKVKSYGWTGNQNPPMVSSGD